MLVLVLGLALPLAAVAQEVAETPAAPAGELPPDEPAVPPADVPPDVPPAPGGDLAPGEPALPPAEPTPPPSRAVAIRASLVKGFAVRNSAGEDLGRIEDLMIMLADGRVPLAAVSFGGVLGLGQNLVPVPQSAVSLIPSEGVAIIDIPADTLQNAPRIDPANWPSTATEGWDTPYVDYWTQSGIEMAQRAVADPLQGKVMAAPAAAQDPGDTLTVLVGASRHSELVNFGVTNREMEDIGRIDDLIFDWEQGKASYLVLRYSPPAEAAPAAAPAAPGDTVAEPVVVPVEDRLIPIPWTALMLDPLNKKFIIDISAAEMANLPGFQGDYADLTVENWDQEFRDFWATR
jgi:sporulation protein YlmC with PRC-barrel domain